MDLDDRHTHTSARAHGEGSERAVKIARTILQKQNYLIKDLGLSQGLGSDVPDDADVVLVLGPTEPFAREELAALERYGSRGGKLFIALDPDAVSWAEAAGEGAEPAAPAPTASGSAATPAKPAPSAAPSALPKAAPSGAVPMS